MMNLIVIASWVILIPVSIHCYFFIKKHNKKLAAKNLVHKYTTTKVAYSEKQEA